MFIFLTFESKSPYKIKIEIKRINGYAPYISPVCRDIPAYSSTTIPCGIFQNGIASPLAGQALTSDVTSFSRVSPAQPRFGAWSSLHEAIYDSGNTISPDLCAKIRQAGPEELNEQDEDGCTPLHTAASLGYHHVVRFLLSQQGIDPSIREYEDNSTARDLAEGIDDPQARAKTIEEFTKKGY